MIYLSLNNYYIFLISLRSLLSLNIPIDGCLNLLKRNGLSILFCLRTIIASHIMQAIWYPPVLPTHYPVALGGGQIPLSKRFPLDTIPEGALSFIDGADMLGRRLECNTLPPPPPLARRLECSTVPPPPPLPARNKAAWPGCASPVTPRTTGKTTHYGSSWWSIMRIMLLPTQPARPVSVAEPASRSAGKFSPAPGT